ncbi:MAG: trigger factor [Candidatus Limnocylindrales bacterium]
MNVTTTPAPRSTVVLEVELPADRLQLAIDESVRRLGRRTRVAGFRPGRAPRVMLERALGVQRGSPGTNPIYDEAKDQLFSGTMGAALDQASLDALTIPDPEWVRFEEGQGATYRVTVPVRPDVRLGDYTDYPFGVDIEAVDDAKVERVIDELRDQHASLRAVEDRPIRMEDWVVVSFEGTRDGQPFDGGRAERFPLVVGGGRMIPEFEAALVGLSAGEEKDFDVTFPDDYPDKAMAGTPAHFHTTVREVREKVLPDADATFAQEIGPAFKDMDALRVDVRKRLEAGARDQARHQFADRVIEYAVANATLDVPDILVDQEVEVMHDELRLRLAEQGIPYAEYQRVTGKDEAVLHAEYREPAEHRVKVLLVLSKIADQEGLAVPDSDIDAEIARARTRYADNPRLLGYFESERGRSYLRSTMRRTQVVERLVDRWLEAHPEVGALPHLEDDSAAGSVLAGDASTIAEAATAREAAAAGRHIGPVGRAAAAGEASGDAVGDGDAERMVAAAVEEGGA